MTLSATSDLSACQNQKPKDIHAFHLDLLNTEWILCWSCLHAVWQKYKDPNEALTVWYKLFMDTLNRHAPIRHKRVKHSKLPPWLNKNISQAMSERDRPKKEKECLRNIRRHRMKENKSCQKRKEIIFQYTCGKQQRYIISLACFEHFHQWKPLYTERNSASFHSWCIQWLHSVHSRNLS